MSVRISWPKTFACIAIGVAVWLASNVLIRFAGDFGLLDGTWMTAMLFLVTFLAAFINLWIALAVLRLPDEAAPQAAAWMCGAVLLLEAAVSTWAPEWHAADPDLQRIGGAWLVWGIGATILMAVTRARVSARQGQEA
jgi:hypothetical protein